MPPILDGAVARTRHFRISGIGSPAQLVTPFLSNPRVKEVMPRAQPLLEGGSRGSLQHELPVP
jgi:hypothetical protein